MPVIDANRTRFRSYAQMALIKFSLRPTSNYYPAVGSTDCTTTYWEVCNEETNKISVQHMNMED